jgi:sigma-B regulation protein RsbU (phosphoserine phosphatase)
MSGSDQDFLRELQEVFIAEAHGHLHTITSGMNILRESRDSAVNRTTLESLYRAAHSLKGSAQSASLMAVGSICQSLENSFAAMNNGTLIPVPATLAVLQHAVDSVTRMLAASPGAREVDVNELVSRMAGMVNPTPVDRKTRDQAALPTHAGEAHKPDTRAGKPLRALIIEDSEFDALLLLRQLRSGGYALYSRRVENAESLISALAQEPWDIVFSDHNMPAFNSTAALKIVRAAHADLPFIIVSGSIGEEVAVTAMKAGAQDYLIKGNLTRLVAAVDRELQDARDRQARRTAENALLAQKEELRIAREIQEHLFPVNPSILKGFEIAGASCPAEATGGDYYDFISTSRGETLIVIGDVSGHGLGPALLMADVRAYLRALAADHARIPDILTRANRLLRADLREDRFITMLLAALTPSTRRLQFINAGHPSGYVFDRDGHIKAELPPGVAALGFIPDIASPAAVEITLAPSDLVVLLTDGAIEATSPTGEEFGITRVLDVVRQERFKPAAEIITLLFAVVRTFAGTPSLQDDLSAVIIKVCPEQEEHS